MSDILSIARHLQRTMKWYVPTDGMVNLSHPFGGDGYVPSIGWGGWLPTGSVTVISSQETGLRLWVTSDGEILIYYWKAAWPDPRSLHRFTLADPNCFKKVKRMVRNMWWGRKWAGLVDFVFRYLKKEWDGDARTLEHYKKYEEMT